MDARAWDERYAAAELVWSAGPNQFVEAECGVLTPGRAVDLAAGEGRNALWLAARGWRVTAVDFSQVALDKGARVEAARDGDAPPIAWECADAIAWRGEGFDLAVLAYLQLPADERRAAVRSAIEALVPGGTLLVVAHDSSNLEHGTGGPQDPTVLYTAEDVLADLDGLAVDVVRAEVVDRVVGGDASSHRDEGVASAVAKDALVRLTRR
ncbi:class I SAM-dependent methyltransferase [Nocardioides rotundus]|uniref:class I SAM-dependent methyltransferase n=1 Tax=Nocardioides rotundus TaxID=1774216 RepID=UPI001CBEB72D|nr:class I SAM-dependent methyltransferase [Nocardioides rotundus]UAL30644.1 class I SAM-dependent methyltransferase [Nocardioides rotundus]